MESQPKTHAILSPSGADRWMTCLGSTALCKGLPDTSNAYSVEGTDYHELAAMCLEDGTEAAEYIGHQLPSGALVTAENAIYLQNGYLDPVRAYAASGTLMVEVAVPIGHLTGEKDAEGTSDAVILRDDGELIVADLKFGRGVEVDPDRNRQAMLYALGVLEKYGLVSEYTSVRLVICQPRVGDGKPKEWTTSLEALLAFREEVRHAAALIEGGATELTPSEKACRFCKVRGTCDALASLVESQMVDGFTDESKPAEVAEVLIRDAVRQDPQAPGRVLGHRMDLVDLVEIYALGVRSAVEIEMLAGRPVIGEDGPYKIVQGKKGNRKWTSVEEAEALLKSFRMKTEQIYDMTLISPTSADKLIAKKNPRRWIKVLPLIVQSEGSKHVANAKDKRPAIEAEKPEEGFEVVEDGSDLI